MTRIAILTILLLATGIMDRSAAVQDENLFAHCAPMDLLVKNLGPEATQATGLTRQAIVNATEARLRSARLFLPSKKQMENPQTQGRDQFFYISVNIVGFGYSIGIELYRYMKDLGYGVPGYAVVWQTGGVGTHSGNGNFILGHVSRHLDGFLTAYLRVNEGHCSG